MLLNLIMFAMAVVAVGYAAIIHDRATRTRDEAARTVAQTKADMMNCEQAMLAAMRERNRYAARLAQMRNEAMTRRDEPGRARWPIQMWSMN